MKTEFHSPASFNAVLTRRRALQLSLAAAGSMLWPQWLWAQTAADKDTHNLYLGKGVDEQLARDWMSRWEKKMLADQKADRSCDKEMGEELGWLVSPYLNGFYYGYRAAHDPKWIELLIDWSDAWTKRGVKEPDGAIGWPKDSGSNTAALPNLYTDNILGEAMALRPMVLMAAEIKKDPSLHAKYGAKMTGYVALAEQVFAKWDARGCWRDTAKGGVWVSPGFGIDQKSGGWTEGYARRTTDGFSIPANKQNEVARWLIALFDVTGKASYRERAEKWWRTMKSNLRLREGKYYVWNYWDPAGPWDYNPNKSTKHWVGVHPNGGYYLIDLGGIVAAYEHGLVFDKQDIDRLVATNRDFMWNHEVKNAKFRRIDGGLPDPRWLDEPGDLWTPLVFYDETLRKVFEANYEPASWRGLSATPWYVSGGDKHAAA